MCSLLLLVWTVVCLFLLVSMFKPLVCHAGIACDKTQNLIAHDKVLQNKMSSGIYFKDVDKAQSVSMAHSVPRSFQKPV